MKILVTGVTGYIGGRLVQKLIEDGYEDIRVLTRDRMRIQDRPWIEQVEVVEGDVFEKDSLHNALKDVHSTYYLIHSMRGSQDFHERDVIAARNFGNVAKNYNVKHIIYLGGLGDPDTDLSKHLRSRQLTGDTLRESGIKVTELQAAVIVGSGSVSFEMIRYLTERIPLMVCPKWVFTRTQPISIRDALSYLVATLDIQDTENHVFQIGGADILTYADMMLEYARQRGLWRKIIPVPVLTPSLSSRWVHFVTPIPGIIAKPLINGLHNESIVRDNKALEYFPNIKPMPYSKAVGLALERLQASEVATTWSDSLASSQGDIRPVILTSHEGMFIEQRQVISNASPQALFRTYTSIGGKRGWPTYNWAWRLRGILDRIVGGVGFRRGRRHPKELRIGDPLDFWRVESIEEDQQMRLRAEMKMPGQAWLQFTTKPHSDGRTIFIQTALFAPKGLFGFLYWYALYPIHGFIFSSMIRRLSEQASSNP